MFRFLDRWNGSLRQLHQAAFTPGRPADADRMMVLLEQRDIELENYLDTELFRRPRGIVGTSGTRPGSPAEGDQIYETDTNRTLQYTGSVWMILNEPWQSYTPTVTQSGTVTHTTTRSHYRRCGEVVEWSFFLTMTGSGTGGNAVTLSLPVNCTHTSTLHMGSGMVYDNSTSTRYYGGWEVFSASTIQFGVDGVNAVNFGSSPNIALASSDQLRGNISYRYTP